VYSQLLALLLLLLQVVRMPLEFPVPVLSVDKVPIVKTLNISDFEKWFACRKKLSTHMHAIVRSIATLPCCIALSFSLCSLAFSRRSSAFCWANTFIETGFDRLTLFSFAAALTSAALTAPYPIAKRP
jgi:hypothetical protein